MTLLRKIVRRLFIGFSVLLLLLLSVILFHLHQIRARSYQCLPEYNGTVTHCPLDASVRVIRDEWGVPHIKAETVGDAHFALGYCMAQDRLFQMECFRRLAHGRLAEILGSTLVQVDCISRLIGVGPAAREVGNRAEHILSPELLSLTKAFLDGINHFIDEGNLPWEFKALGIGCEPFQLSDCFAVAGTLAITFADGLRTDLIQSMIREAVPEGDIGLLFNTFEAHPVTIMERPEEAAAIQQSTFTPGQEPAAALEGVQEAADWLSLILSPQWRQASLGSNSWVLSGERTASGKPIIANDPHIPFTNPSIWYEAHVSGGDFNSYGYYLTPLPVPLLGHNAFCGWALTMLANDDTDIYELILDPENPDVYFYQGAWHPFIREKETIRVRFGRDRDYEYRRCPFGVVCNDFFDLYMNYEGPPLAVRWSGKQKSCFEDLQAFYEMACARDYESFETGVRKIRSYRLSVSYADGVGNIAWWGTGTLAWYPPDVNPKCVIPAGKGEGVIPDAYLTQDWLHLKNPPEGMIITANNRPTVKPVGTQEQLIPRLPGYFKAGDRAGRIREILLVRNDWTLEALQEVQMDDRGYSVRRLVPKLIDFVRRSDIALSAAEEEALGRLENWDYAYGLESTAAILFRFWYDSIFQELFQDILPPRLYTLYAACEDNWFAMQQLVEDETHGWWDRPDTVARERAPEIVTAAWKDACARLTQRFGEDQSTWRWGRVHQVTYTHPFGYVPLLGRWLNIGPLPSGGSNQTINNMLSKKLHNYTVIAGASTRRLIDFAAPEESYTILPTGNSGQLRSPHYADQAELFVEGKYRKAYFGDALPEEGRRYEMTLHPAG